MRSRRQERRRAGTRAGLRDGATLMASGWAKTFDCPRGNRYSESGVKIRVSGSSGVHRGYSVGFSWLILIDLGIISCALLTATLLRSFIGALSRYRIPSSITAGFILLPFYNYLAPGLGLGTEGLGNLVFHLLNLSFVAMSLRAAGKKPGGRSVFPMAVAILSQYSLQSLLGLGVTFLFIATVIPGLFPGFGLLVTL